MGVAGRLRVAASDSLELSLGENPLGRDGGPGGRGPSSEEDVFDCHRHIWAPMKTSCQVSVNRAC